MKYELKSLAKFVEYLELQATRNRAIASTRKFQKDRQWHTAQAGVYEEISGMLANSDIMEREKAGGAA